MLEIARGTSPTQKDIDQAATKALGEKKCFACQTWKSLDAGSQIKRNGRTQWKCFTCQNKRRF